MNDLISEIKLGLLVGSLDNCVVTLITPGEDTLDGHQVDTTLTGAYARYFLIGLLCGSGNKPAGFNVEITGQAFSVR